MRVTKWLRCIQLVNSYKNCKHEKSIQHIAKKNKASKYPRKIWYFASKTARIELTSGKPVFGEAVQRNVYLDYQDLL